MGETDSKLRNRHFLHRLHPLTLSELPDLKPSEALEALLKTGGFPESFLLGSELDADRWRKNHLERILKEDLLDLEPVRQIKSIEILIDLLAQRVGSPISMNSLARDLEVSPHSIKKWIGILESLYVIFIVTPYTKKIQRAILKEPKIYFFDTGRVEGEDTKIENEVARSLLKHIHVREDQKGETLSLHYVRDKEKREVDFLIKTKREVEMLIEVKSSQTALAPALPYFSARLTPKKSIQLVKNATRNLTEKSIDIVPLAPWLAKL